MVVIVSKVGNFTFDQTRFGPKIMPRLCAFILFKLDWSMTLTRNFTMNLSSCGGEIVRD